MLTAWVNGLVGTPMSDLTEKEDLLESSGYRYHFDRMIYFNRAVRRAFSLEFVEDRSRDEIAELVAMPTTNDWDFHFNSPPSDRVKRELAQALEK